MVIGLKVDGVFSGGGIKAVTFIGALEVAEEKGFQITRAAGTSAGAIFAALIIAGYDSKSMKQLIEGIDLKTLLDPKRTVIPLPFIKWLKLYWKLGLYKGDALEEWIASTLKEKGIETFADLPAGSLRVIASDITKGRMIVIPDDLEHYGLLPERFSIAKAVRMSAGLPYFFEPVKLYDQSGQKSYIVDGGVLSNFPIWVFQDDKKKPLRPVLGFQLGSNLQNQKPHKVRNAIDLYQALFETMKEAHDARHISEATASDILFIPVKDVITTEFDLTDNGKQKLIEFGADRAKEFFGRWNHSRRML
jgi:NTE family protein